MRKVPLCIPAFGPEEINAVTEVMNSGWLAHGPKNKEFEKLFCDYLGVEHAVSMNSCTTALYAALLALGIEGEVVVPSFTFVPTVNAILHTGATPVLADCDPRTLCIDPEHVEAALTPRTKAILPVHFAGRLCDMDALLEEINDFAKKSWTELFRRRTEDEFPHCVAYTPPGESNVHFFSHSPPREMTFVDEFLAHDDSLLRAAEAETTDGWSSVVGFARDGKPYLFCSSSATGKVEVQRLF